MQDKIKINDIEIYQPDSDLASSFETTFTADSGRVQSGVMHATPMFTVEQFSYMATDIPVEKAKEIFKTLSKEFMCSYDETASIGKRYRRQDVIGTPWCVTVDDETLNNNTVTIRNRDDMSQITLSVEDVIKYINDRIQ